ncbi:hypothetical protein LOTGIDRAFT_229211 [Lottia gigantea]|uniref:Uncharacterized protein n=1 Tax=Lottia gigantea TaxID=225164 RepID=V4BL90_LOTGI|nr:hypothetical protein LOTGIDRAFT_229211 [Lottia gigantea]ESO89359.1 hypothetical protein LOTGIDRAFT_229211 [Lottia gigantea]
MYKIIYYVRGTKPCNIIHNIFSLLEKGHRNNITEDDMWDLESAFQCKPNNKIFKQHFTEETLKDRWNSTQNILRGPTSIALLKSFRLDWCKMVLYRLGHLVVSWFAHTYLLRLLIENIGSNGGYLYALVMALVVFIVYQINNVFFNHALHTQHTIEHKVTTVIYSSLYDKSLKIPVEVRKNYSVGEISNLLASDVENVAFQSPQFIFLGLSFLHIPVACYFLFQHLGISALTGVIALLCCVPASTYTCMQLRELQDKKNEYKDKKMEVLNDMLNGIKVVKLNAWETYFCEKLTSARENELQVLQNDCFYRSVNCFFWNAAPFLVSLFMFATHVYLNGTVSLDAKTIFIAIGMVSELKYGINEFPESIYCLVKITSSLRRIQNFLFEKELPESQNEDNSIVNEGEIVFKNCKYQWEDGAPVISIDNINIRNGSLVAIIGRVGAGKSTFLSSILGEVPNLDGKFYSKGSISYVPQQAWIQNATLKNNILFGQDLNEEKYQNVIESCCLKTDLQILPAGDQTEIGEKGINLSGGQKQRVCLARSLYTDADIYLFDDPLSAVDSHVGQHLFKSIFSNNSPLKSKTRLLVTHNLSYLDQVDTILLVSDNSVQKVNFSDISHLITSNGHGLKLKEDTESSQSVAEGTNKKRLLSKQTSSQDGKFIEEESIHGKVQWSVYKGYFETIGKSQVILVAVLFFSHHLLHLLANIWLTKWTDQLDNLQTFSNTTGDVIQEINIYFISYYGGYGVSIVCVLILMCAAINRSILQSARVTHHKLVTSVLRSPMSFFETTPIGRINSRFDLECIDNEIPQSLLCFLESSSCTLMAIITMCYGSKEILLIFIPMTGLYLWVQQYYINTASQFRRMMTSTHSAITSFFNETLMGTEVIRAFHVQERFKNQFGLKCDKNFNSHYHKHLANRWLDIYLTLICTVVSSVAIFIFMTAFSSVTSGVMGLAMVFIGEFAGNFVWFVIICSVVDNEIIKVERILEFINSPNEADWEKGPVVIPKSWPPKGEIQVKNLCVSYRKDENILHNVSFLINTNEKVGVVGRTGAGKSSLMLSLFRLVEPVQGSIFIDDVDIGQIGLHQLRSKISIIPQDPILFIGSIRMNLDPTDQYTDDEIWTVLKQTHLYDTIKALPNGLLSPCGEGGNKFSAGERQLLCLARSLLRKCKILILDEATAAVDMKTDDLIQETLRCEFKHCTVLTIAHRINTVLDYDRIMVLDKGRIAEIDTPKKLLQDTTGIFYNLVKASNIHAPS